jgi:hypothetical protein
VLIKSGNTLLFNHYANSSIYSKSANLMLNSLDALGEGGRVTLRASTSRRSFDGSSSIRITIADNGQGIGAAAAMLFDDLLADPQAQAITCRTFGREKRLKYPR